MSNLNVGMLPDSYAKDIESNNYKLLQLLSTLYSNLQEDLQDISDAKDIENATGATLDQIGAMAGVSRNGETDPQYRLSILARVAALATTGTCNSTIARIEQMLGMESGSISIIEPTNVSASVSVIGLTTELLQNSGYTTGQIESFIKSVIPAGVTLFPPTFAGTLRIIDRDLNPKLSNYPTLYKAWLQGQIDYVAGNERGLKGTADVPEIFAQTAGNPDFSTTGTYTGGTLGISTGDDLLEGA